MLPVGQEGHRTDLLADLAAAIDGDGRVVIIGGEAGIGKTTLVRSLAGEAVQRNVRILEASCFELYSTPAFGPWLNLFANLNDDPELPVAPAGFAGGSMQRITDQAALFASVRDYFIEITRQGPVLLVLEDLHWSDPASLDLLRELSRRASRMRLLIVVTYRTDDLARSNPFYQRLPALVRETGCRRIALNRLDREQLRTLVDSGMDLSQPDAHRLVDYLARHSDGNPFYATELIRALHDRGLLTHRPDGWELAELDQLVLPPLLMQVIDSRVSRLGNAIRELLAIAAIVGQEVPLSIWSDVAGAQRDELLKAVERASDAHLMEANEQGTSVRFVHALTQNALYASVLPPRRREWHGRVARTLMGSPHPDPDSVAHHLNMAGDPDTWRWLVKAAERARNAYAWTTAIERYRAAVEQVRVFEPDDPIAEGKLLYNLAFIQRFSNPAAAVEDLERARQLPGFTRDPIRRAESLWGLAILLCYSNRFRAGLAHYVDAFETLDALTEDISLPDYSAGQFIWGEVFSPGQGEAQPGEPAPQNSLAISLAAVAAAQKELVVWLAAAAGEFQPAMERMHPASSAFHPNDESMPLAATNAPWVSLGQGIVHAALGQPKLARNFFAESRANFKRISHHALESQVVLIESADVAAAYGLAEPSYRRLLASEGEAALRRAGGALRSGVSPRIAWLRCLVIDGRWDEAADILESSPTPGNAFLWRNVRWSVATLARYRGDAPSAWEQIRQVFPNGSGLAPGDVIFHEGLELQRLAADLCLGTGEIGIAREWLTAHDQWLEWSGTVLGVAHGDLSWARLYGAESNDEAAAARAAEALRRAAIPDLPGVRLGAHQILGEVALRAGRFDDAIAEASMAIEIAEICELPYERALALTLLSEAILAAGRSAEVIPHVTEAIAILTSLQAGPALRRTETLAQRMELEPAVLERRADLTERELEVLRLIVAGRSNQGIADDLFISWATARTHVSNIFRKLGVGTRAEAVDVAHRRRLVTEPDIKAMGG